MPDPPPATNPIIKIAFWMGCGERIPLAKSGMKNEIIGSRFMAL